MEKQLENLKKQNEGIETSLKNRGVEFTKLTLDVLDIETELKLIKDYNEYLKNVVKQNKPEPKPKETKLVQEQKPKEKTKHKDDEEDDDESTPKDVKPVYETITNMEGIKSAFFSKEYDIARELIKQHPFKFYKANYKYSSDNDGRPDYVAKNLVRGFVQSLDDYRKYLMVCFRCILVDKEKKEYKYPSYWIVNTNVDLLTVIGDLYNNYDFVLVEDEEPINRLLKKMEKNENSEDEALIGEMYVH